LSDETPQLSSRRHYAGLDGLRGLAILLVFFYHYGDLSTSASSLVRFAGHVKGAGWMGVDLFFVLSGFLITGILFDTRRDAGYFRNFYVRRALRLFPVFYGTALLLLLMTPIFHYQWRAVHAWYLLYGANFVQLYDFDLANVGPFKLMHFWSLALEEQFYMVWPLAIFLIADRRRLLWITVAIMIVAPLVRIALLHFEVEPLAIYTILPTRMDGFAAGAGLSLLLRQVEVSRLRKPGAVILAVGFSILVALAATRGTLKFSDPWMIKIGYSTLAFMFAALLVLALQSAGFVKSVFTWRPLRFYGLISYGFYVYHELIHDLTKPLYRAYVAAIPNATVAGILYVLSVLTMVTIVSFLSYRYFEALFLRMKPKFQGALQRQEAIPSDGAL
jgi:peptidoglycan/LPS O-acetylase OafA/YrhL